MRNQMGKHISKALPKSLWGIPKKLHSSLRTLYFLVVTFQHTVRKNIASNLQLVSPKGNQIYTFHIKQETLQNNMCFVILGGSGKWSWILYYLEKASTSDTNKFQEYLINNNSFGVLQKLLFNLKQRNYNGLSYTDSKLTRALQSLLNR